MDTVPGTVKITRQGAVPCGRCEGPDLYEVPLVVVCLDRVVRAYGDAFDIATLPRDETPPIPEPDVPTGALFCRDCGWFFGWVA